MQEEAGGYSEGHWGAGVFSPRWNNWQLYGEMLIGAGGGGGVDSGSAHCTNRVLG